MRNSGQHDTVYLNNNTDSASTSELFVSAPKGLAKFHVTCVGLFSLLVSVAAPHTPSASFPGSVMLTAAPRFSFSAIISSIFSLSSHLPDLCCARTFTLVQARIWQEPVEKSSTRLCTFGFVLRGSFIRLPLGLCLALQKSRCKAQHARRI